MYCCAQYAVLCLCAYRNYILSASSNPLKMSLCAYTGPVLGRCWYDQLSTGLVLAYNTRELTLQSNNPTTANAHLKGFYMHSHILLEAHWCSYRMLLADCNILRIQLYEGHFTLKGT